MAKVLVTGGAGFIGSHIVDALVEDGLDVAVIDDLSTGVRDNLRKGIPIDELDIRIPEAAEAISGFGPDIVVHAAAQISVSRSMREPVFDTEVNLVGLVNMLEALTPDRLPYFVFLSTGGALYGEQETFPADESHAIKPTSVYGLAKYASELYLDCGPGNSNFRA